VPLGGIPSEREKGYEGGDGDICFKVGIVNSRNDQGCRGRFEISLLRNKKPLPRGAGFGGGRFGRRTRDGGVVTRSSEGHIGDEESSPRLERKGDLGQEMRSTLQRRR